MGVSVPGGAPGVRPRGRRRGRGQGGRKQGRRATAQPAGTGAACELDHILVVQVHPHPAALVTARHGDVDGLSRRVGRLAGRRDEVDGALGCAPVRTVRVAAVAAGDGGRVTGGAGLSAAYAVRVIVRERSTCAAHDSATARSISFARIDRGLSMFRFLLSHSGGVRLFLTELARRKPPREASARTRG